MGSFSNPLFYTQALDENYYIGLGRSIASGYMLGEPGLFYMDPLYGYFVGALFFIFGADMLPVRLLQIVLDSASAAMCFTLGGRFGGKQAGYIAGTLYAIYGPVLFFSLLILKTTLSITLCLLFTLFLIKAMEPSRKWIFLWIGALGGLMMFTRGNLLLISLGAVALIPFIANQPKQIYLRNIALFIAGLVAVLSIGGARSYVAAGEFAILPSQGGRLLYLSQNPENTSGRLAPPSFSRSGPETLESDFHKEAERRLGRKLNAKDVSSFWTEQTIKFYRENPTMLPVILWRKLTGAVMDFELPDNQSYQLWSQFSPLMGLPFPTFAFIFALGAPGLVIAARRERAALIAILPVAATFATMLVFYPSSRFRMEAIPFFCVGAGFFAAQLMELWRSGKKPLVAISIVSCSALFIASKLVQPGPPHGDEETSLTKAYINVGDFNKAWETASAAAVKYPTQSQFRRLMGLTALSAGDAGMAITQTTIALNMEPDSPETLHNLGLAYLMKGNAPQAIIHLEKAARIYSGPMSQMALGRAYEANGEPEKAAASYRNFITSAKPGDPMIKKAEERLGIIVGAIR